jgi:hypothetical protein
LAAQRRAETLRQAQNVEWWHTASFGSKCVAVVSAIGQGAAMLVIAIIVIAITQPI